MTKTKTPNGERVDRVAETMERTTAAIVAAIADGIADPAAWSAPWHAADPSAFTPTNIATGNAYTGGNRIALYLTGAPDQRWGTFNQWRDAGHPVPKGCHAATYILRPMSRTWEDEATGETRTKLLGWKAHAVWHAAQVGCPAVERIEPAALADDAATDIAAAFTWTRAVGAHVIESPHAGASYSATFDQITAPAPDRWTDAHGCWSTLAHELTHWTGHDSRLARDLGMIRKFGDDAYAAEELTAELGAAFTLAAMGRSSEPRPDHARYLAHWLRVLNSAPDALWTVASRAERAATYIAERAPVLVDA